MTKVKTMIQLLKAMHVMNDKELVELINYMKPNLETLNDVNKEKLQKDNELV